MVAAAIRPLSMTTVASMSPWRQLPQPEKVPSLNRLVFAATGAAAGTVAGAATAADTDIGSGIVAGTLSMLAGAAATEAAGVFRETALSEDTETTSADAAARGVLDVPNWRVFATLRLTVEI